MIKLIWVYFLIAVLVCLSISFVVVAPVLLAIKWSAWWLLMYLPYAVTIWMYNETREEE